MRQEPTGIHMFVEDEDDYFQNMYRCHNYEHGCMVQFKTKYELDKHDEKCVTVNEAQDNPIIIQSCYNYTEHPLEYLRKTKCI
mgnify:CR=1 FL=1